MRTLMMHWVPLSLILLMTFASGCGTSADDIRQIKEQAEQKLSMKQDLQDQLSLLKASLAGEETRLESIREFHFTGAEAEKARQIATQERYILELKEQIERSEKKLNDISQ